MEGIRNIEKIVSDADAKGFDVDVRGSNGGVRVTAGTKKVAVQKPLDEIVCLF